MKYSNWCVLAFLKVSSLEKCSRGKKKTFIVFSRVAWLQNKPSKLAALDQVSRTCTKTLPSNLQTASLESMQTDQVGNFCVSGVKMNICRAAERKEE